MLACATCGIPYVPVPADCPPARLEKIREIVAGGSTTEAVLYIIFTSGSTGEPKGVQITRANAVDFINWLTSADFSFSVEDIFANPSAFSFDLSVFDFLLSLHLGATLILSDAQDFRTPGFLAKLGALRPSVLTCTPSMLSQCLATHDFDPMNLPSLKDVYLCGETLPPETVNRFFARFPSTQIHNTYGPTEATVFTTHVRLTPEIVGKYPSLPVGRVKPGTEIRLSEGEITITGANVADGYLGRPELTLKNFSGESGTKTYRTGDLGHFLDGFLFFNGRIDNQVKMHGFRIELGEIDAKLKEFVGVEAAITLPLKRGGEVKKLASFIQASQAIDLEALRAHLSQHLPEYMIPGVLRLVENYPLSTNGKIDSEALLRQI
jgi:D-alanine--poly(phosphoribitol) ligase subunit 1